MSARATVVLATLITRRELCARLGISKSTSHRMERDGRLPRPVRLGERCTRWILAEVEAFERRLAADRGVP